MRTLLNWIADIYTRHGVAPALVTIVTLTLLIVGVAWFTGLDINDLGIWLTQL
jgi:hypothetical protein